jgi:AraC family transcriptional regulator, transcriptional activator FtrA
MEWLIAERLELARGMLESGAPNIESVAEASGLGSAATMRHHFRRHLGISPASYRQSFARERS